MQNVLWAYDYTPHKYEVRWAIDRVSGRKSIPFYIAYLPCVEGAELSFMNLRSGNDISCRNDNVNREDTSSLFLFDLFYNL